MVAEKPYDRTENCNQVRTGGADPPRCDGNGYEVERKKAEFIANAVIYKTKNEDRENNNNQYRFPIKERIVLHVSFSLPRPLGIEATHAGVLSSLFRP